MRNVELIYDPDCPNVGETRAHLLQAFAAAEIAPSWREWSRDDPSSPPYAARYASPTVLVDGAEVGGVTDGCTSGCRLYRDAGGRLTGVPPVEVLVAALTPRGRRSPFWLVSGSALVIAMLPNLGCPPVCEDVIRLVNKAACPSCEVQVLDMRDANVAKRARGLGVRSVPAVAINGKLADCCTERGPDLDAVRAAGLGVPLH